ncbi:sarcosine oxidase subunit delta [Tianweitania sp. Rool2]|uniref:Sarcosine oxidase subunit delta n=2 Tax=Oryzicola mucosus TaxID=2767425 RepID=A0A8J6PYK7_9HYPH|nr:sarcosine oxidase subunit delta [Oryzicola mucosus]MBD0416888.1 sarcosine oxidase subunit delta [Oryzicola mucosus]
MQLFPCPFCGPRSEAEFHFGGDAGNVRPDEDEVSADRWSSYLYMRHNQKGMSPSIWMHMTCGELFQLDRDTLTHSVAGSKALTEGGHR